MGKKVATKEAPVKESAPKTKKPISKPVVPVAAAVPVQSTPENSELAELKQENYKLLQKQTKAMNAAVIANVDMKQA